MWSLITESNPQPKSNTNPDGYTSKDYDAYAALVRQTDVINSPLNVNKKTRHKLTNKYRKLLKPMLESQIGSSSSGHWIQPNFLPSDIKSLVDKLQVLIGEFLAGNKTTRNQIIAIVDNLRERNRISEKEYREVNDFLQWLLYTVW